MGHDPSAMRATAVLLALVTSAPAWFAAPAVSPVPTATAETAPDATVVFNDQETSGGLVLIDAVRSTHGGFVVIHDDRFLSGERVASVRGSSGALGPGLHHNVPVTLDRPIEHGQRLVAIMHHDANGNDVFELPRQGGGSAEGPGDVAYTDEGDPIGDTAMVTVAAATDGPEPSLRPAAAVGMVLVLGALGLVVRGLGRRSRG